MTGKGRKLPSLEHNLRCASAPQRIRTPDPRPHSSRQRDCVFALLLTLVCSVIDLDRWSVPVRFSIGVIPP